MDDAVTLPPLTVHLPPEFSQIIQPIDVNRLESYEDHLSAALEQIAKRDSSSWGLADIFSSLTIKFGETSQTEFASQLKISRSTVTNYLRTARAFPATKRLPNVSFTHHMIASFADEYDGIGFLTDTRHQWVEQVAQQNLRTKHLQSKIKQEKEKQQLNVTYLPCYLCSQGDVNVLEFIILVRDPSSSKRDSDQYLLHRECYNRIKSLIDGARIQYEI